METKNTHREEQDIFITELYLEECRGIKNFKIPLSTKERKHLIITGKNGSGKTSLLELFNYEVHRNRLPFISTNLSSQLMVKVKVLDERIGFGIERILKKIKNNQLIYVYIPARKAIAFEKVSGITKIDLKEKIKDKNVNTSIYFLQYLANLKASKAFAIADGELDAAKKIDEWFNRFENLLKNIFNNPKLELKFDRKNYSFLFIEEGKDPYSFETLSDGYASVIAIVAELIMRMEAYEAEVYDVQGVVLIDEIESHLHVDLQKKILPFLTTFFPKIQFIVTTHSPFVISSMKDAVVCDLEHKIVANDLSTYSYDALLESYFGVDKYSSVLKEKVTEYEVLSSKKELAVEEEFELEELRAYLDQAPLFLSKELQVKLQQIDLNNLNKA